jgi:hypothetical protein
MRRFNRETNRLIIERLVKEQQEKEERVDKLAKKFRKKVRHGKSDCPHAAEYEICKSRLKFKK